MERLVLKNCPLMRPSADEALPGSPPPAPRPLSPAAAQNRRLVNGGILLAVIVLLGLGFWSLWQQLTPQLTTSAISGMPAEVAVLQEKSIAVLPFQNLSEDPANAYFAGGVQDDILTALSKLSDLKVISRTSVNTYPAGESRNFSEIAQTLGVSYVLDGAVQRTADRVRIVVHLTDARTSSTRWSESYDRDLNGVVGIPSEIVRSILGQLQVIVSPEEKAALEERPTKDLVAYGLYIRAKSAIETIALNPQVAEKLHEGVQFLQQAVERDPHFYLAYCQLANAQNYLYFFGVDHTPAQLTRAEEALNTVQTMRPDAPETHLARAGFYYRCYLDYDRARAELALARKALPNNSEIYELNGYIDRRQGRWDDSARSLRHALELDPRNFFILQQIALSYQEFRQFGGMAASLDRALALLPRDFDTHVTRALVDLEWSADPKPLHEMVKNYLAQVPEKAPDLAAQWLYLALCEHDAAEAQNAMAAIPESGTSIDLNFPRTFWEAMVARLKGDEEVAHRALLTARAELEKATIDQPNYGPAFCVLGMIDAALGRKDDAIREGQHAIDILPLSKDAIDGAELVKYLAVIYAWTGEKELALQQIEKTLKIPSTLSYGNLKLHPFWDSLRQEARFQTIVAAESPKQHAAPAAFALEPPSVQTD